MFANAFSGWHLVIILAVVVLLFGATKLPALAKGIGQSIRIFRSEVDTKDGDSKSSDKSKNKKTDVPVVESTGDSPRAEA